MNTLHTDFWMDRSTNVDVLTGEKLAPSKDYIKLAATKRAIANFVSIVTGKSIPVKYNSGNDSYTDGEVVTISSKVDDNNFDHVVGLALHEGSHCALTDFNILTDMQDALRNEWNDAGKDWYEDGGFEAYRNLKEILNYVEDRRIDYFVYSSAPGYKAYYKAMYKKYFEANIITKALKSGDKREVTRENYMFRIINFTNTATDLDAIPGLRDIWNVLDLRNIKRLKSTQDALNVAAEIETIIATNIAIAEAEAKAKAEAEAEAQDNPQGDEMQDQDTPQDGEGQGEGFGQGSDQGEDDGSTAQGGEATSGTDDKNYDLNPRQRRQLDNAIQKQKDFMEGDIKKSKLSKADNKKVDAMTEADVNMKKVGEGTEKIDWNGNAYGTQKGIDCIVINNMTKALIESGLYATMFSTSNKRWSKCIEKGTRMGTMLGRKLQVRNEDTTLKTTRLRNGKIDRRLISSLGHGAEAVFSRLDVDTFNPVLLYLSIDASGSMSGYEWEQAQTAAVAIAKAASMVSNMDVVITYRSVDYVGEKYLPCMLIAYDSRKDKFSKITRLFAHIKCSGSTPEGLCFEATMAEMLKVSNNTDTYFINFSDGMPGFSGAGIDYYGECAINHTKTQVERMRAAGIKILSYFICSYDGADMTSFRRMYGKDAEKIATDKIMPLAKSLNSKFAIKG